MYRPAFLGAALGAAALSAQTLVSGYARRQRFGSGKQSSCNPPGGNGDQWRVPAGKTVDLSEAAGAGAITHLWFTTQYRQAAPASTDKAAKTNLNAAGNYIFVEARGSRGRLNPKPFSYAFFGAPFIAMAGKTGGRYCCYRWHSESPQVFERYLKRTIEHGHGNILFRSVLLSNKAVHGIPVISGLGARAPRESAGSRP